ncbi:MAG: DUF4147 domain-containing protein [Planctomycetes bacterium]|nr:DUF4147 domain-containing protein [Planctomycetota bacterium]
MATEAAAIWRAGVDAVQPLPLLRRALRVSDGNLRFEGRGALRKFKVPLKSLERIVVVGAGKAGAGMASAIEEILGDDVLASKHVTGLVNVPDATVETLSRITLHPARSSHDNNATAAAYEGTKRIRKLVSKLGQNDLVLVLLSGGGSALLPAPADDLTLEDKQTMVRLLQSRGADIQDLNCVRKHLSAVKGGGLLRWTRAGLVVTLAISDVMGDALDVIASGPTSPDPTTFSDALRVLARYGIDEGDDEAPPAVLKVLKEGANGVRPDTAKTQPDRAKNLVVGGIGEAVSAAKRYAEVAGWRVLASNAPIGGDTLDLAQTVASFVAGARGAARSQKPSRGTCLISGGETTVKLGSSPGLGGRNQELVLAVLGALEEEGLRNACVLSGGTDGEDGPTDAAGAWADAKVARRAAELGLDPAKYLMRHDSYHFFEKAGGLLKTGWTGTNVMDLRIALVATGTAPS